MHSKYLVESECSFLEDLPLSYPLEKIKSGEHLLAPVSYASSQPCDLLKLSSSGLLPYLQVIALIQAF